MTKPSSIPERVTKLEQQMTEVSRDAGEAIHLAREADRDVADVRVELRAQRKLIQALRETQVEQGQKMDAGFKEIRHEMRDGFGKVAVGMAYITALLTVALEQPKEPPT